MTLYGRLHGEACESAVKAYAIGIGKLALGIVAGAAATTTLLLSDTSRLTPMERALAAVALALGAGSLPVSSGLADLWLRRGSRIVGQLDYLARRTREEIALAAKPKTAFTPEDIGVHVYVAQRRTFVPWRYELLRKARSSKATRTPNPANSREVEHWRTGDAPGIAAAAWKSVSSQTVDLQADPYRSVTEQAWAAMTAAADPRTFGRTFAQISTTKRNFGAILAVPIQTEAGRCVGVMTMNIESAVQGAVSKLDNAKVQNILKIACADAGNLVLS